MILRTARILLPLLLAASIPLSAQVRFEWPVEGELNRDWYIVNYVDHDTTSGLRDPHCGVQTYDGHQGTDIVLASFRSMDSGVRVLAAANGVVTGVIDTAFDRNKESLPALGYGNYIAIYHGDSTVTYYAHIRRGSALVEPGDTVVAGQPIALVGSAGNSTDPHLHFEVWRSNTLVDPFAGECNGRNPAESWWNVEPPYDTLAHLIDHGIFSWSRGDSLRPTVDTLRERPAFQGRFLLDGATPDTAVTFWAHVAGVRPGDTSTVQWSLRSGNDLVSYFTYSFPHTEPSRYYYWWSYILTPPEGQYQIDYSMGALHLTDSFTVARTSSAVPERNDPVPTLAAQWLPESQTLLVTLGNHPEAQELRADLVAVDGREIERLYDGIAQGSQMRIVVPVSSVSAGLYFVRLTLGERTVALPLPLHP